MFEKIRQRIAGMGTIRALLEGAEQHALRDGKREPGAEHLVLAAIDLPDGTATLAFAGVGVKAASFGEAVRQQYAEALRAVGLDLLPPSPEALDARGGVFTAAASAEEVMRLLAAGSKGHAPLLGAHIIAAVAGMEHGVAARALRAMGVDRLALMRAASDITREYRAA